MWEPPSRPSAEVVGRRVVTDVIVASEVLLNLVSVEFDRTEGKVSWVCVSADCVVIA